MYQHGGDIYSNDVYLDFSVNLNPLGMPGGVCDAIKIHVHDYETYPDYDCRRLRECIRQTEKVPVENILCGNGAADLIYGIVNAARPQKALLAVPSFLEYERALNAYDCEIEYFYMEKEKQYNLENTLSEYIKALDGGYDIAFVCCPNNPVGNLISMQAIMKIADKCRECKTLLVLDVCFIEMCGQKLKLDKLTTYENIVVLNAFTKTYSMAGVRLGYMVSFDGALIKKIKNKRQSWSISAVAQVAGIAALEEQEYLKKSVKYIAKERKYLDEQLTRLGFKTYPGEANFIFFENVFEDEKLSRLDFKEMLMEYRIMIRSCANYRGLDDTFYRIAVKNHIENIILIRAMERIINKSS